MKITMIKTITAAIIQIASVGIQLIIVFLHVVFLLRLRATSFLINSIILTFHDFSCKRNSSASLMIFRALTRAKRLSLLSSTIQGA